MLKGMYVFAEEKVGLEAFGLVYVPEKGAYYGQLTITSTGKKNSLKL